MQTSSQQVEHKPMQTRDQKYAVDAYNRVKVIEPMSKTVRNQYGSMAHKLPILIRTAGLAQALTFVEARGKDKDGHILLLRDLSVTVGKPETLAAEARDANLSGYIYLTQQILAALLWYKRFAQSILDVQAGTDGDER